MCRPCARAHAAGLAGLCAARDAAPGMVQGVQLIDISLRMLHVERQSPLARPFVAAFQRVRRGGRLPRRGGEEWCCVRIHASQTGLLPASPA